MMTKYSKMNRSVKGLAGAGEWETLKSMLAELHFPMDNYFFKGKRKVNFLGEEIIKYHRTLTTYLNGLLKGGFDITGIVEPQPPEYLLHIVEGMEEDIRRPKMLIVAAKKK